MWVTPRHELKGNEIQCQQIQLKLCKTQYDKDKTTKPRGEQPRVPHVGHSETRVEGQ
ncbi:hypothetical protein CAPTEDRAFT_93911 [Capitella teleta]|uniref:Uncharacterized protein n=1 Tax=Capitella teleta TaxID=283909 RepID=R7V8V7_CAPTE|nr:hypothetical protein CAPTEDRAFT_93911 [Capitella teleta]|eukprot:ELU12786.1 hypothetical protein CAPTEDRAFT_93911 [Capitella teleta]